MLTNINYIDFLREVGSKITINTQPNCFGHTMLSIVNAFEKSQHSLNTDYISKNSTFAPGHSFLYTVACS